jgi:hypothetical protein
VCAIYSHPRQKGYWTQPLRSPSLLAQACLHNPWLSTGGQVGKFEQSGYPGVTAGSLRGSAARRRNRLIGYKVSVLAQLRNDSVKIQSSNHFEARPRRGVPHPRF